MAMGMAMAAKLNHEEHRVYCIIGDGECDEGAIWESALIAHQYKLDNFIVTIDFNKIQSLAPVEETLALEPLDEKCHCRHGEGQGRKLYGAFRAVALPHRARRGI